MFELIYDLLTSYLNTNIFRYFYCTYPYFLDIEGTITGNTTVAKQKIEIERESFTPASPASEPASSASPSDTSSESSTGDGSVPGFGFSILLVSLSFLGVIVLSIKRKLE